MSEQLTDKFDVRVYHRDELPESELSQVHELFGSIYRDANHAYLDKSVRILQHIAVAKKDGTIVGFGMGTTLKTTLPGMREQQTVSLGGIGCIAPQYRRQRLFGHLSQLATGASGLRKPDTRVLSCGRMAHPAGFRGMSANPTVVPKFNVPTTTWQREIGLRVAELYEVTLDPETFVVQGEGTPIGYPNIKIDVPQDSWRVFENVNRDKGASLLGVAWSPDAPDGW